jgi:hypothetical protein
MLFLIPQIQKLFFSNMRALVVAVRLINFINAHTIGALACRLNRANDRCVRLKKSYTVAATTLSASRQYFQKNNEFFYINSRANVFNSHAIGAHRISNRSWHRAQPRSRVVYDDALSLGKLLIGGAVSPLHWDFTPYQSLTSFRERDLDVRVQTDAMMPRWDYSAAVKSQRARFRKFIRNSYLYANTISTRLDGAVYSAAVVAENGTEGAFKFFSGSSARPYLFLNERVDASSRYFYQNSSSTVLYTKFTKNFLDARDVFEDLRDARDLFFATPENLIEQDGRATPVFIDAACRVGSDLICSFTPRTVGEEHTDGSYSHFWFLATKSFGFALTTDDWLNCDASSGDLYACAAPRNTLRLTAPLQRVLINRTEPLRSVLNNIGIVISEQVAPFVGGPIIAPQRGLRFVASSLGFLNITDPHYAAFLTTRNAFFKKVIYSFLYKDELQRFVMRRYAQTQTIDDEGLGWNVRSCGALSSGARLNTLHTLGGVALKARLHALCNHELRELAIKRIRFKPGYMTQWRSARRALKLSLQLPYRYQYRMTRFINRLRKYTKINALLMLNMQLQIILTRGRILPDALWSRDCIAAGLVYLNGAVCKTATTQTLVGDFIQLIINAKYYIMYRRMLNLTVRRQARLRNVLKKKSISAAGSDDRQKSRRLPAHLVRNRDSFGDVAGFCEVDFFTLSLVILYEPQLFSDFNVHTIVDTRFGVINLYNWKYIT